MQGLVVLHEDVQIVPLAEIPPQVRDQLAGQEGDFALTRPWSRNPSKVIDANSASLLGQFRTPRTIVDGILAYSREAHVRAADVLDQAYPLIESCLRSNLLVEPGADAEKIHPSFAAGDSIDGNIVERAIQAVVDSEVYQVRTPEGRLAVLKIATPRAVRGMERMLAGEADILRMIGGAPAPTLFAFHAATAQPAPTHTLPWLLAEWFDGEDGQTKAQTIRETASPGWPRELALVCANIADAYAALHERRVVHGDVHTRNILVSESGEVRVVDYGISRVVDSAAPPAAGPRAGVAFFFEPEYARAVRSGAAHPAQTLPGEQYSVASLLYFLLCGNYYLDFSFDKDTLLRQIAEDQPLAFERRNAVYPAALEAVIRKGLAKDPAQRFASTREFARAFRDALETSPASRVRRPSARDSESSALLDRVLQVAGNPRSALQYSGPESPTASVTYGHAGIAFAAYRIACARDDARLFALADVWAERAAVARSNSFYSAAIQITPETVGRVSPYHTPSGVAVVQGLLAGARGDRLSLDSAVGRYLMHSGAECSNPDVTLGNASVLLGLMLLLEGAQTEMTKGAVSALREKGEQLAALLHERLDSEPVIGSGGSISYLGMAHGWAGLLYAAMRWSLLTGSALPATVPERLQQLAAQARFTQGRARWPVQITPGSITMPGWCNGSSGYVYLWTLAHRVYSDARYLDLAAKAAADAFEAAGGGHGLCCGFAGQAYAQLNLYNHTGDGLWLEQARTLAEKAAATGNGMYRHHGEGLPHSLYKGDVGVAVLLAELEKPESAALPFFESLR